jgi:hypothetical protein
MVLEPFENLTNLVLDPLSVASAKTMPKSVFSIATNITSGSEEDETDINKEMDVASGVKIEGMEMVEMEVQGLTDNMNHATANLELSSSESAPKEDSQGENTKDNKDSSYTTHDNSYRTPNEYDINSEDYDEVLEVSSGEFDAVHANKFQAPKKFRQQLWNKAGPTVDSMMVQLAMIKEYLEDEEAGMPFKWMGMSKELRAFLDKEAGEGISDQLSLINDMLAEMYQMNPTEVRTFDPLSKEPDKDQNASKTEGTPPRAKEARPKEEAATPDRRAGRDKEGVQSLGMASGLQLTEGERQPL